MVESEKIFGLESTEDLPESCKSELRIMNVRDETMMLLNLFDLKSPLSFDEIIVGLYRLHKLEKTRVWVSATLYNLNKKGLVRKVEGKKGIYEKV